MRRILHYRTLPAAFVLLLAGACSLDFGRAPEDYVERAQRYLADGDIPAAVIELSNALQKDAEYAEAHWLLGNCYLALREGPRARRAFDAARSHGFEHPRFEAAYLRALLLLERYARVLERTVSADADADVLTVRGEAHLGISDSQTGGRARSWLQGYVNIARGLFNEALALDPEHYRAHLGLARVALWEGDFERAMAALDRAEEFAGNDPGVWILRGMLGQLSQRAAVAESAYRRAIQIAPYDVLAKLNLVRVLVAQRKPDEALELAREIERGNPRLPTTRYLAGFAWLQKGEPERAVDVLEALLADYPGFLDAEVLLGRAWAEAGRAEEAYVAMTVIVRKYPEYEPARRVLAQAELKRGNADAAIKVLAPLAGDETETLALLGRAHIESGDVERGQQYLARAADVAADKAIARDTLDTAGLAARVQTDIKNARYDKAAEVAARLVEREPEDGKAHYLAGSAFLAQGDTDRARAALEASVRLSPGFVPALMQLAAVEEGDSRQAQARALYERVLAAEPDHAAARERLALSGAAATAREDGGDVTPAAVAAGTEAAAALLTRAKTAHGAGDTRKAVGYLRKAVAAVPDAVEPRILLARELLDLGDVEGARTAALEALAREPAQPGAMLLLSEIEFVTGTADKALATAAELARRYPESADTQRAAAVAYLRTGDLAAARAALGAALALDADHAPSLATSSHVEFRDGQAAEAEAAARRLIRVAVEDPEGYKLLGDALLLAGDIDAALAQYEAALARPGGSRLIANVFSTLRRGADPATARTFLHERAARYPEDVATQVTLAADYQQSGQTAQAIAAYERVLGIDPDNAGALNDIAWMYHEVGRPEALQLAERAHALKPDNPAISDTLGWILVEQGDLKRGVAVLRAAVARAPTVSSIRYHLAVGLAADGDRDAALSELAVVLGAGEFPEREAALRLAAVLQNVSP